MAGGKPIDVPMGLNPVEVNESKLHVKNYRLAGRNDEVPGGFIKVVYRSLPYTDFVQPCLRKQNCTVEVTVSLLRKRSNRNNKQETNSNNMGQCIT